MSGNRLVSIMRFKGISYETKEKSELNRLFNQKNRFLIAIGKKEGKDLMIQTWTAKTTITLDAEYDIELPVLQELVDTYTAPFRKGKYRQVIYSIAFILKYKDTIHEGISRMKEIHEIGKKMLSAFEPTLLGIDEPSSGALYSQVGRFLSLIVNGFETDVLVSDTRLGDAVIDSTTNFSPYDYVEVRPNRGGIRYATTYDLRDYPMKSKPGMWDEPVEEQFDFTLVQTFAFEDRNKVKLMLQKQTVDLSSAEGDSGQVSELEDAVQKITQGETVFGRYHAALIVYGDTPEKAIENGARMEAAFLSKDTRFIRSTLTNDDTWLSLFPGNLHALYPVPKSTDNLACGFSLHTTPVGKPEGNPPGDGKAWMPFRTVKEALYFFNAHNSPVGVNNTGERLAGHIAVHGSTGVGKTTLEALMMLFASRWGTKFFILDYNQSFENLARALGTTYFNVEPGYDLGVNLFQLEKDSELEPLLKDVVTIMAGGKGKCTEAELKQISESVSAVLDHEKVEERSMSLLLQNIPPTEDENCLNIRLSKWCRYDTFGRTGDYAWVCDSPKNKFDPKKYTRMAFDCTKILKKEFYTRHPELMEVFMNTMFYLKTKMHEATPEIMLINFIAEYWVPLSFEGPAEKIKEILKAGRTRLELMVMDTQSPEDASRTQYAPDIIQQVVTQIWLANDKATPESYKKFGIEGKEYEIVSGLDRNSQDFLIKQGSQSAILNFTLSEKLKYWLPILSSDFRNVRVAKAVREKVGSEDPRLWVKPFLDEMQRLKERGKQSEEE
jgi:type IV secretion system protein VirB4